jgi:hypothetical protein
MRAGNIHHPNMAVLIVRAMDHLSTHIRARLQASKMRRQASERGSEAPPHINFRMR